MEHLQLCLPTSLGVFTRSLADYPLYVQVSRYLSWSDALLVRNALRIKLEGKCFYRLFVLCCVFFSWWMNMYEHGIVGEKLMSEASTLDLDRGIHYQMVEECGSSDVDKSFF